jgi:hypothetical protein
VKTNSDAIATKADADDITVADGTYNYISAGTDVAGSLVSLDSQVKTNSDAITTTGITFTGDTGTSDAIKLNDTLAINGDSNITTKASAGTLTVQLNNSIDLGDAGSMTIGDAILNTSGLTIGGSSPTASLSATGLTVGNTSVTNTGLVISGGPGVTANGIDAGGKKITGVAPGEADTDAVNMKQFNDYKTQLATGGAAVGTGNGIIVNTENKLEVKSGNGLTFADGTLVVDNGDGLSFDGNKLKVNAGAGLTIADDGALKVNAGGDLEVDTTTNTLQVKKNGTVASDSEGLVTGKTVYSALSTYAKSDGATLTSATISSGSIAEEVTIGTGDSAITVGSLKSSVATNANNINTLSTTVSGHTASISALDATVNDADTGLVKKVGDNTASIGEINSSITGINDSISTLSSGKANVNLDNITDDGKSVVRGLAKESVKVVAGTYTTVDKGSDGNADVYAVSVTADGVVDSNNTGLVTGGAVYRALQEAYQPDGEIAEGEAKAVSGGTVYSALSAYAKVDGATLTGATISSGSIADTVMLGDSISVGGLKSSVSENTTAIDSLKSMVGNDNSGLVQKVNTNESSIKTLQNKTQNITATEGATTIKGTLSAGATTVTSLTDGTATLSGGALTGVTTITASGAVNGGSLNVGTGAITGGMAKVMGLTVGAADVTTALTTKGAVAENNAGFVTGGVVYSALQAYQPDGVIEDGNTKAVSGGTVYSVTSKLDERITANEEAIATKADASTVAALSDKVSANETSIKTNADNIAANTEAIASNKSAIEKNASDITALSTKITANETELAKKADKANTLKGYGIEDAYTKEDSDTLLNKKADKTELDAVKVVVGNADSGLVKDVNDLKNASQNITSDDQGNTMVDGTLVVEDSIVVQGKDVTSELSTEGKIEDNNHGYLDGDKVYDYLNKGKDSDGKVKIATESTQISIGKGSEAIGEESIAIGNEAGGQTNTASGKQSIAIGFGNRVTGDHSGAIGDPSIIDGTNSYSVGNSNKVANGSNNVFVLGNNVNVTGSNTVVLGGSSDGAAMNVSGSNSVVLGAGSDGSEDNVVSVGADGNERRITHVAPGENATDAATVGQVYSVAQSVSHSISKLDSRVNKVGAGAAALAALHPIEMDSKFGMGIGYGNYRSANAMSMGIFYRPSDNMLFSIGGSMGNGENMLNAGITIALDKGLNTSKAVMAKNIKALSAENAAIKEENADMRKQLNAQDAKLTTQEAEIQALKAALARLEAKIGK